jgi:catechol 2,3-dioxygenase-like lactoylglutathione lyase family enzyme
MAAASAAAPPALLDVNGMLGNFLEISVPVRQIGPALQFYRSLGFQELPTGDFVPTPYAVVWDGAATVGLYESDESEPTLRFARPDLKQHVHALRRLSIGLDDCVLGDDTFNSVDFEDSAGHRVRLVEARTFSPGMRDPAAVSACGALIEISLPTHSAEASADFWTRCGLAVDGRGDAPYRWVRLSGHGLTVGFHETRIRPGLSFVASDYAARTDYLRARGHRLEPVPPLAGTAGKSASIVGPDGIAILIAEAAAPAGSD